MRVFWKTKEEAILRTCSECGALVEESWDEYHQHWHEKLRRAVEEHEFLS